MKAPLAAALAVCASAAAAGPVGPEALAALPPAQVVVLGEVHDNPAHHANQARAVAALRPAALVFEMLTPAQAARITSDLRGDPEALATALEWESSGWPDFGMYHAIIQDAPGARIFGAGLPREALRPVITGEGPVPEGIDGPRLGLDRALPEAEQRAREAEQHEAHCGALPETLLPGMVRAQRWRDAALAQAVLDALERTGGPVAVITGNGHARRDWGVPRLLQQAAPGLKVLSIGQFEAVPAPPVPFDLWLVARPVPRGDPCKALR